MRARRLSEAAKVLAQGSGDILSVALDAGYGSHEAFTRAFRQHFGLTPEQLRAQVYIEDNKLQEPIKMDQSATTPLTSARLVKGDALLIFGLGQRCPRVGNPAIPSQWKSFLPYLGHVDGQIGNVAYGVIYNSDDFGGYDYICGVAVREFPSIRRSSGGCESHHKATRCSSIAITSQQLRVRGGQSGSMGWPTTDSKPWTDQRSSATANNSTAARASAGWKSGYQ